MERESQMEEARRRPRESTERLKKIKERHDAYNLLVTVAGDELEAANNVYMYGTRDFGGDSVEAWQAFDDHCKRACFNFKCAILSLHKLAEIAPSHVNPQTIRWIEDTINKIADLRIDYWEKWGKHMRAEAEVRMKPAGKWQCPAQVAEGITDMLTVEAANFCLNECKYQDRCQS